MLTAFAVSAGVYFKFNSAVLFPIAFAAAAANLAFVLRHRHSAVAHESPTQGRPKHRVGRWIATMVFLLPVSYVLGAPVTVAAAQRYLPAAMPMMGVVYGPLRYYARHPELPGSKLFKSYAQTIERLLK